MQAAYWNHVLLSFLNQNVGQADGSSGSTLLSDRSFDAQSSQITQLLAIS